MTVDLNIGDPWLRPPRTAKLLYGSTDPKAVSAGLPTFLYEGTKPEVTSFRMKKVKTTLNTGKLDTQISLTRRFDGQA